MYILDITYKSPLEKVDQYLSDHVEFLDKYYSSGKFITSGRKVPRSGGIILVKPMPKEALESIIEEDPFHQHDLAEYKITEFVPSKAGKSLVQLLE